MTPETREHVLGHAREEFPRESCGLIIIFKGRERYIRCRNIAERQSDFIMHPEDFARSEELGEIVAVVHSHCNVPPIPSDADRVSCEQSRLPWHIISLPNETWGYLEPTGYKAPLIGRPYSHGVLDCYSLIRDWYLEEMGIEIPDYDRDEEWWKRGGNLYQENFEKAGFRVIDEKTMKRGDGILMQIESPVVNHAAIYLGNGLILQHLQNRLSGRDVYGGYWQLCTRHVVRYFGE